MIRGLILDYGEVLCTKPAPGWMERMAEQAGQEVEPFIHTYFAERGPYDGGELSPEEYWSRVAPQVARNNGWLDQMRRWDIEMWVDLDARMINWIPSLRAAGLKTALLSNMPHDMAAYSRQHFAWLAEMDFVVLSCELRLIKPDPRIYRSCVEGLQLSPSEVLFIDDREANVEGARRAGLRALQFRSIDDLRIDLGPLGIPLP